MSDAPNGDAKVTYSVKEILAEQSKAAEQRHAELTKAMGQLDSKLTALSNRVGVIEQERTRREGVFAFLSGINKVTAGVIAMLVMLEGIPAALFYLGQKP